MPTDDADLETAFTVGDYSDVDASDDTYVDQTATSEYAVFLFKDYVGEAINCTLEWEGQTNNPPTINPVLLQIYNRNSGSWETVDTNSTATINTDFILTGSIPDLTDYKDDRLVISCRVYQLDT